MIVGREEVRQLKDAGYTYHELAEIAKCPTPEIMQLGQYGTAPSRPIQLEVEELLKAKAEAEAKSEEAQTTEGNEIKSEKRPYTKRAPKPEEQQ